MSVNGCLPFNLLINLKGSSLNTLRCTCSKDSCSWLQTPHNKTPEDKDVSSKVLGEGKIGKTASSRQKAVTKNLLASSIPVTCSHLSHQYWQLPHKTQVQHCYRSWIFWQEALHQKLGTWTFPWDVWVDGAPKKEFNSSSRATVSCELSDQLLALWGIHIAQLPD